MTLKEKALEIYKVRSSQREALLAEIPEKDRWIVKQYIANLARAGQDKNRAANAYKSGFAKKGYQ